MYTVVVNDRLKSQGLPQVSQIKVMGAICSHFLLAIRSGIINDYQETSQRKKLNYPTARIASGVEEAARATAPRGPSISYLPGARRPGCNDFEGDGESSSLGPLRWNSRGPDPLDRRLPEVPRKVRGRVPRSSATAGVWELIRRAIEPERQTFAESGYSRFPSGSPTQEATDDQEAWDEHAV